MSRLVSVSLVIVAMLIVVPAASAATRYVDPAGSDAGNDCLVHASPCQSIQRGVDVAATNDTVVLAPGDYAGGAIIAKQVTVNGAQAGIDGRTRSVSLSQESRIVGYSTLLGGHAVLDGVYFDAPAGTALSVGTATVRNAVFAAADSAVIMRPSSGALIERSRFTASVGVAVHSVSIPAIPIAGLTVRDNVASGPLIEASGSPNLTISGNVVTAMSGNVVSLGTDVTGAVITGNDLTTAGGGAWGVGFDPLGAGSAPSAQITQNQIVAPTAVSGGSGVAFTLTGNRLVGDLTGSGLTTTSNWYGCNASCPTSAVSDAQRMSFGNLTASAGPYISGVPVTITVKVGPTTAGAPAAGWPVTFSADSGTIGSPVTTVSGGVATTTWTPGAGGAATVTATLDGEALTLPLTVIPNTEPPNAVIDTAPASPRNGVADATWTFHATDVDTPGGPFTFECQFDGGSWTACDAGTFTVAAVGEGAHTFAVRASDSGGLVDGSPASRALLVDLTKPTITVTNPPVRSQDGSENVLPTYLFDSDPAEAFGCVDPLAGTPAGASGVASCGPDSIDTGTLGVHGFAIGATDNAGNASDTVYRTYRVHPPRYGDYVNADSPRVFWRMDDAKGATSTTDSGTYHTNVADKRVVLRRDPAISCEGRPPAPHRPAGCEVTNDPQGYSAFFPGDNGAYVSVDGGLAATPSYAMEAWIKPVSSADGGIMDHGVNNGALFIRGGRIVFHAQDVEITGPVITPGAWSHVAGTYTGGVARLYVNGTFFSSTATNQLPSGGGTTFYVGRTDHAISPKAFHGFIDEAAYYDHALSARRIWARWHIGTFQEAAGPAIPPYQDMNRPTIDTRTPANGALYSLTSDKVPLADFSCADIEDPAPACVATVDGAPIADGAALPQTAGEHTFTVVATDASGLHYTHAHRYYVESFRDLIAGAEPWSLAKDVPTLYYRFDEPDADTTAASQTGYPATYKNDPVNGPVGISGDGNTTRSFLGRGGYAYVPSVPSAPNGFSIEAWVRPSDAGNMGIFDHGGTGGGPSLWIEGGQVRFRMPDGTTVSAARPAVGTFFAVHARWDGVLMSLWIDGAKVGEAETTKAPSGSPSLYVGMVNGLGLAQPWFRGLIDEVSYYAAPLRDGRVFDHYFADPPAPGSTPPSTPTTPTPPVTGGGGGGGGGGGLPATPKTPAAPTPDPVPASAPSVATPPAPAATGPVTTPKPTTATTPAKKKTGCAAKKTKKQRSACYAAKRKAEAKAKAKAKKKREAARRHG